MILEAHGEFVKVFCPLAQAIDKKHRQMQDEANKIHEAESLLKEKLEDSSQLHVVLDRVEDLTAETRLLAFDNGQQNQARKYFATKYSDEWSGTMGGWFRSWYICLAGCSHCNHYEFAWCRTCWKCVMKRENLENEAEARTWIVEHKADCQRRVIAAEKYEAEKKHQLEFFTKMPGMEKCKARNILETRNEFWKIFSPLAQAIVMKDLQMEGEVENINEAQSLLKELRELTDSSKIEDALDRVMLLTADTRLLAFCPLAQANVKMDLQMQGLVKKLNEAQRLLKELRELVRGLQS